MTHTENIGLEWTVVHTEYQKYFGDPLKTTDWKIVAEGMPGEVQFQATALLKIAVAITMRERTWTAMGDDGRAKHLAIIGNLNAISE